MNSFLVVILNSLLQELSQGGFHICGRHCFALAMLHGAKRNRNSRNSRNCVEREVAYMCQCGQWQVLFAEEKTPSWLVICSVTVDGSSITIGCPLAMSS